MRGVARGAGQGDHAYEILILAADESVGVQLVPRGTGAQERNTVEGGLFG
jgi:hypothetical protein